MVRLTQIRDPYADKLYVPTPAWVPTCGAADRSAVKNIIPGLLRYARKNEFVERQRPVQLRCPPLFERGEFRPNLLKPSWIASLRSQRRVCLIDYQSSKT